MRRAMPLLLVLTATLLPSAGRCEEQCGTCHPEVRVAFADSIHSRERITCTSCHGGNPQSLDVEEAHRGRFRTLADRLRIPAMCADCHADLERMRPYNLPVDQYAVYQTSQHGGAVAGGDARAAVCTDCHGAHDIRAPENPRSSANVRNIPATCGNCHGNAELMEDYDLDPQVVEGYRTSLHGQALLREGNLAAPDCTSCHGVHGATPPGVGDVDKVCGACHTDARRAFLGGPHYPAMAQAGLPECASCHSDHAIRPLQIASLEAVCAECHGEGSAETAVAEKIRVLIESARSEVERAERLVVEAERVPLDVEDHLGRLEEARTYLTEALPLVHTVSPESVEIFTRRARGIGEEVQRELYSKLDRTTVHLGLVVFWFYVLMTLAVLVVYKRRLGSREVA